MMPESDEQSTLWRWLINFGLCSALLLKTMLFSVSCRDMLQISQVNEVPNLGTLETREREREICMCGNSYYTGSGQAVES